MTDLIEAKTADLSGEALGWAVGVAEGLTLHLEPPIYGNGWRVFAIYKGEATERCKRYNPWEDWALGGPLISKYQVALVPEAHDGHEGTECSERWYADVYFKGGDQYTTEHCDSALMA
ncbi:phage protein NinX family protein, partial [Pseudomonas sp. RAC1]|uniref:phage protein NinX family protein n=1 Tax=Pseudomonas sp. RAC1 TaxID=3064900 RepID=UPI00271D8A83